jgi:hypothetical protein
MINFNYFFYQNVKEKQESTQKTYIQQEHDNFEGLREEEY